MLIVQKELKISEFLKDITRCAINDVVIIFHFLNFLMFFRNFISKKLCNVV